MKITVLGASSWGTALALHFSQHGNEVALWSRNTTYMRKLQADRENKEGLPGFTLPDTLHVHTGLGEALKDSELAIIAIFVAGLRDGTTLLKQSDVAHLPMLVVCKGFEQDTGLLTFQVAKNVSSDNRRIGVLSGLSFVQELAQQLPCAVVPTPESKEWTEELIPRLSTGVIRLYGSNNAVGVTVGGVAKNIMAIATGFSDNLEYSLDARVASVTRGLTEITRLTTVMGAQPKTLMGLTGIGDLISTYTGTLSYNRRVDLGLVEGKELHQVLMEIGHVPEGVSTIEGAFNIAAKYQIGIPTTQTLPQLTRKKMTPQQVVERLMKHNTRFE